jgi:hypothetical protein
MNPYLAKRQRRKDNVVRNSAAKEEWKQIFLDAFLSTEDLHEAIKIAGVRYRQQIEEAAREDQQFNSMVSDAAETVGKRKGLDCCIIKDSERLGCIEAGCKANNVTLEYFQQRLATFPKLKAQLNVAMSWQRGWEELTDFVLASYGLPTNILEPCANQPRTITVTV